jgi:hypothetical protein
VLYIAYHCGSNSKIHHLLGEYTQQLRQQICKQICNRVLFEVDGTYIVPLIRSSDSVVLCEAPYTATGIIDADLTPLSARLVTHRSTFGGADKYAILNKTGITSGRRVTGRRAIGASPITGAADHQMYRLHPYQ